MLYPLFNKKVKNLLPSKWRYVAWIDADIKFLNDKWAKETIDLLAPGKYHFLQLYSQVVNMGPDNETLNVENSVGFQYKMNSILDDCNLGHPGFAWATSRFAFEKTNGLIDEHILGSSDYLMSLALLGKSSNIEKFLNKSRMNPVFASLVKNFEKKCQTYRLNFSNVDGKIQHYWHGRLADRQYIRREFILVKHKFDISKDLIRNETTYILKLSQAGKRMEKDIRKYFSLRNEDITQI